MRHITHMTRINNNRTNKNRIAKLVLLAAAAIASLLVSSAQAAAPGITGPSFDLTAAPGYISQPDGSSIYSWGYGCNTAPGGYAPATITGASCTAGVMQLPGPTLIVNQGDSVTVTLHNNLPAAAGNTSILFPGFSVTASGGAAGLLTREAANLGTVTYSFVADTPGTHTYYSGTQGDLQIEMGLYGAIIVLPALGGSVPTGYATQANLPDTCHTHTTGSAATLPSGQPDFRLAAAAYNHPAACYDREYLFQFSEIDPMIHSQAQQQVFADEQKATKCTLPTGCMVVATEPYVPAYFMVNGRSMPDLMEPNYAVQFPHQPYNGNPHMHPGELVLLRVIGTGRWQHPFHEHGNHVRVLARDGNLLLTAATNKLAGPLLFTTTTTPGQTLDGIFQWTGKGLNWDVYAHTAGHTEPCSPDANGYYTTGSGALPTAPNYYEWCADHEKALESKPFGQVGSGGPVTLPDPNILANGAWYGGSPYLGPEATARAVGSTPIPPSGTVGNSPTDEAGFAYMWHSHNEREITTNNAFPGGMMMMMLVDPWVFSIIEAN
ncbi:MAG TPA: multicopper oxidase family protein [Gallionellaceae bacterium]|nr:multicopper oxidase family protein [Gallionellaceae bacterium]